MGFQGIVGHELLGEVIDGPRAGERVVCEINFACGHCGDCARGLGKHCAARTVMGILNQDGAFAEEVAVPLANLHRVPDDVPDDAAVFVEPLAAAFEILEQLGDVTDHSAWVLGDGELGLLIAQVLQGAGADITLVGKHDDHLAIARDQGIATTPLSAWSREKRELVVDATGSREGFGMAVAATRPRGRVVLKSTVADPETSAALTQLVIDEITVVGSRCGPFAPALAALLQRSVIVEPLIAAAFPLTEAPQAFARAAEPGTLKVVVVGS